LPLGSVMVVEIEVIYEIAKNGERERERERGGRIK
jgi:hypothetical protein